jgi:hypothetical protein
MQILMPILSVAFPAAAAKTVAANQAICASAQTAGGQVSKLGSLLKGIPALAAAAYAGYQVGTAALETVVDPELKRQERGLNKGIKATDKAQFEATQKLDPSKSIKENEALLKRQEEQLKKTKGAADDLNSTFNLGTLAPFGAAGALVSIYSQSKGPTTAEQQVQFEKADKAAKDLEKRVIENRRVLEGQRLKQRIAPAYLQPVPGPEEKAPPAPQVDTEPLRADYGKTRKKNLKIEAAEAKQQEKLQAAAQQNTTNVTQHIKTGDTTININAKNADAQAVGRVVKRQIKRELSKDVGDAARSLAVGEQ